MKVGQVFELLGVGLKNMGYVACRTASELRSYGGRGWWWRLRIALRLNWFGTSPLGILKKETDNIPDDLVYGETFPGTAYEILQKLDITAEDSIVDLGCGRGVVPLTAALAFGIKSCGIDIINGYIERCRKTAASLSLEELADFLKLDFRHAPLPKASIYFIAGTCLSDESWKELMERLEKASKPGTRAVSLSQPLPSDKWDILRRETMPFTWGPTQVYFQIRSS